MRPVCLQLRRAGLNAGWPARAAPHGQRRCTAGQPAPAPLQRPASAMAATSSLCGRQVGSSALVLLISQHCPTIAASLSDGSYMFSVRASGGLCSPSLAFAVLLQASRPSP